MHMKYYLESTRKYHSYLAFYHSLDLLSVASVAGICSLVKESAGKSSSSVSVYVKTDVMRKNYISMSDN